MDFNHTEDRRLFADTIAKFLGDNYDYMKRNEYAASQDGFSKDMWSQFAELGALAVLFDEDAGGFAGQGFDIAVVFEELGKAIVVEPFLANLMAGRAIAGLGDDAQKSLVEEMIAGGRQLAFAHTEAQAGYAPAYVSATVSKSDGVYKLNGHKAVVLNGGHADTLVVSARSSGKDDDESGIGLFLVAADAQGLRISSYKTVDGYNAADIWLEGAQAQPLGNVENGFETIEKILAVANVALSAEALGAMQSTAMITLEFLKTRKQFGVPIGKFQVLQHRMAELMIEMEQVRSAVINAAGHLESNRNEREWYVSAVKNLVGRTGRLFAEEAIQMHGGIGMTWEYSVAHFAKRLVMIDHLFGDEDFHLDRIVKLNNI